MNDRKKYVKICALVAGAIALFWTLQSYELVLSVIGRVLELASPLLIGFVIAFILGVPLAFLEKHFFPSSKKKFITAVRRPVCIVLSLAIIIAIIALVFNLVIPELIAAIGVLARTIPIFFEKAQAWAIERADTIPELEAWLMSLDIPWNEAGKVLFNLLKTGASGILGSTFAVVSGIFSGTINFVISFIFALYILLGKEKLKRQISLTAAAYLPKARVERLTEIVRLTRNTFSKFITGQCTEAVILGTLCWLGMELFRFPYAPMVGALIGMTALIPVVGAFLGGFVGGFMIFTVSPIQTIWFVVFILFLQQLENNLIYPRVVGTSVGLPAMWVLAAVTIGGGLFGVVGMLIGVPTFSVFYSLMRDNVARKLKADAANTKPPKEIGNA